MPIVGSFGAGVRALRDAVRRLRGGENDATFATYDFANRSNGEVRAIAVQSDGKILAGGLFTAWNGVVANRLVRLNSNGSIDMAFITNMGSGSNNQINAIAIQPDGKILLGGQFTTWNGATANRVVRLNADGTVDAGFLTNAGTGAVGGAINAIAVQPDGMILIGGNLTTWNGVTAIGIVRLNADGTRDSAFSTNTGTGGANVTAIGLQSDGKVVIVGEFTAFNGVTVGRVVRLNSDGTRDTIFTTNNGTGITGSVMFPFALAIQSDGKIVIGGSFNTFNGVTVNRIVRLNADGSRDTAFSTNVGASGSGGDVNAIVVQADGKIVIGGHMTAWGAFPVGRAVRLNSDGTREGSFSSNIGTGANDHVRAIAVQPDGSILFGGAFRTWRSAQVNRLVRVDSSGSLSSVVSGLLDGQISAGAAASSVVLPSISAIAVQQDQKILVGGAFATWNGVTVNNIVRLNPDGALDSAFTASTGTAAANTINAIAVQSDGKIVIGGAFTSWGGATVNRIVRLNSDGTRDTAFTTNTGTGAASTVSSVVVQSDGKILIGGAFSTWTGVTVGRIVRLNADGTRDTAFTSSNGTGAGGSITAIAVQPDGKVLVGGAFTTWNGVTVGRIVRLGSDGTLDSAFRTNTGTGAAADVSAIAIQSDGKIVIGGNFTTFNGVSANRIARLNSDGTLDEGFSTSTGSGADAPVASFALQANAMLIIGGQFTTWNGVSVGRIIRVNSDGTRDTTFTGNAGVGASGTVSALAMQNDGLILLGGSFTGFNNINRTAIARIGRGS